MFTDNAVAIQELVTKTKFARTLDANSSNTIFPLLTIAPFFKAGYRLINEWYSINDCIATNMITSLAQIAYPVFDLAASESEKEFALLNLQWKSPRVHLNFYLDVEGQDRAFIKAYGLLSPKPYPYADIEIPDFNLGNNAMISVGIQNVGYGLLQGGDKVVITGELTRNIWIEKISDTSIKIANLITTNPSLIVNTNNDRNGITFVNTTDKDIYLDTLDTVSSTAYLHKLLPGDEISEGSNSPYTGEYYAIVEDGTAYLEIREFS